jgi:hypothetical protein
MPTVGLHEEDAKFQRSVGDKQCSRETTKCKLKEKNYSRLYPTPALWQGYNITSAKSI